MTTFQPPQTNPFGLTNAQEDANPTFVDIDGDGDLDAFIGNSLDNAPTDDLLYFENVGSASSPAFATPVSYPFGLTTQVTPQIDFGDIDNDGDLDAFVGLNNGNTVFFENTGSATAPAFAAPTNPSGLNDVGFLAAPELVDIDGDGDLDLFIGENNSVLNFFENTGSASSPTFVNRRSNPFGLTSPGGANTRSSFVDFDGDGDFDAFVGSDNGTAFYENTGSASAPAFAAPVSNPFGLTAIFRAAPDLVDIDNDGDFDAFIGNGVGDTLFFENVHPAPNPSLDLVKKVNGDDANDPNNPLAVTVGDAITYTYEVTNTSNVSFQSFAVADDNGTPGDTSDDLYLATIVAAANGVGMQFSGGSSFPSVASGDTNGNNIFDPGETWLLETGSPQAAQLGLVTNEAIAVVNEALDFDFTANPLNVETIADLSATDTDTDTDTASYEGSDPANPGIDLTKFVNGEDRNDPSDPLSVTVGDTINYTYTVENTGDVALSNVELRDDNGTPGGGANASDDLGINVTNGSVSFQQGINFVGGDSNGDFVLDPGETWQFAADPQTAQSGLVTNLAGVGGSAGPGSTVTGDTDTASYEGSQTTPETEEFLAGFDCYLDASALPTSDFTISLVNLEDSDEFNSPNGLYKLNSDSAPEVLLGDNPEVLYFPNALFDPDVPFIDYAGGDDVVIGENYFRDNLLLRFRATARGDITTEFGTGNDIFAMQDVVLQAPNLDHNFLLEDGDDTVIVQQISTQSSNTQAQFDLGAGNDVFGGFERFGTFSPGELRPDGIAAVVDGGTGTDTFFVPEGNVTFDITFENGSFILTDPNGVKMQVDNFETFKACTTDNTLTATELQTLVTNGTITNTQELLDQLENPPNPGIDLTKFVNGEDRNDPSDPLSVTIGDTINYTYTVENTGNVALSNVELRDDNGTPGGGANASDDLGINVTNGSVSFQQGINFVGGDSNGDFVLDPGETWQFAADPQTAQSGLVTNLAGVGGSTGPGSTVTGDTDTASYQGNDPANPGIDLTKFVNGEDRNNPSDPLSVTVGDAINYTYTVENTGDVPFSDVLLGDDNGTPGTANISDDLVILITNGGVDFQQGINFVGGDSNGDFVLDPGETWQFAADQQTAQSGLVTNTAVVGGDTSPSGLFSTNDNDTASYQGSPVVPPNPDVSFEKQVNGQDADTTNDLLQVTVGDAITYTYEVTNTGNTDLTQISLVDDNATPGDASDDQSIDVNNGAVTSNGITLTNNGNGDGTLAPGETWVFTLDAGAAQSGIFQNTATLTTGPDVLERTDTATYLGQIPVDPNLTIDLEKFVNGQDADTAADAVVVAPGAPVTYTYTLTNTSTVAYRSVSLQDDNGTIGFLGNDFVYQSFQPASGPLQTNIQGVQLVSESGISNNILDPGETWTFRSDTQTAASGLFTNFAVAEVHRTENLINSAVVGEAEDFDLGNYRGDDTVQPPTTGTITVVKDADVKDGTDFNFSGDLGSFTLDDANPDDGDTISNTATFSNQAPGSYSVEELAAAGFDLSNIQIQGDTDGGSVIDLANNTVDIDLDAGEDITVTFENTQQVVTPNPSISFNKLINGVEGPLNLDVGDTVNYTYEVTNDGNVDIRQVRLRDNNATPLDNSDDLTWTNSSTNGLTRIQDGDGDNLLEPGETWTFEADAQLAQDGTFTNRAVIRGRTPDGSILREVDTATYTGTDTVTPPNIITGTTGMDMLDGTAGRDIITGLEGMDMMSGGAGDDDFVFNNINEGLDYISDFESGADRLILSNLIDSLGSPADPIGDGFIQLLDLGATGTLVQVDPDGSAGSASTVNLVILENVNNVDPNNDFVF